MSKKLKKIVKASITHVSLVPKGANGVDFLIVKGEEAPVVTTQMPILKINEDKHIITGVVYEPNIPDSQGDFMDAETIEKTAYDFMENHQNIDIKHDFKANENIKVVENYITKSEETIGDKKVQPGTWVMSVKVNDDTIWEGVKKGDFNGFSMGGSGIKEEVEDKEAQSSVTKDEKGLFSILKSFFSGEEITKSQTKATPNLVISFKARAATEKINEIHWALRDAINMILKAPDITNKKELVSQQIDEYKDYVLQEMSTSGIQKMCEALDEEAVEKAGKAISGANEEKMRKAYESLGEILSLIDKNKKEEGEELDVKKEELQEIIKSAVQEATKEATKGIDERLQAIEKGDNLTNQDETITKENIAEMIKGAIDGAVNEAISPLAQRMGVVEKSRGISNQLTSTEKPVTKSANIFSAHLRQGEQK